MVTDGRTQSPGDWCHNEAKTKEMNDQNGLDRDHCRSVMIHVSWSSTLSQPKRGRGSAPKKSGVEYETGSGNPP